VKAKKKIFSGIENLELYTRLMKSLSGIEIKGATMPYTSINGNMFSFLKNGEVGLRLPPSEREDFLKKYNSKLFETFGTVMKEYVTIDANILSKINELKPFVKKSLLYAKTLKPKVTVKK
jgi:hypothetical protein